MQKFVSSELNALEFAQEFSDRLLADREEANNLLEDFQKQANIELNPNIFEFSKLILDFELLLEVYQNEVEELETGESSENDLSFTQDSILEGVKRALRKSINVSQINFHFFFDYKFLKNLLAYFYFSLFLVKNSISYQKYSVEFLNSDNTYKNFFHGNNLSNRLLLSCKS